MYASQTFWFFAVVLGVAYALRRKKVALDLGIIYGAMLLLFLLPLATAVMKHFGEIQFLALDAGVIAFGVYQLFKWLKIAMKGWWIVVRLGIMFVLVVLIWIFLF